MESTSEYSFPIFISSTDYNLKDLRAELANFLAELGYRPMLSSASGFADRTPHLQPWESCLPVLSTCFVMVLIIDGRYGAPLDWPNYPEITSKISPTHAEYQHAHKAKKRMLVFIRRELMAYYESFRKVMADVNKDLTKARAILEPTLPKQVQFETLVFISEIKTTSPIPWINEFDDSVGIKKEIQRKMLNELAEIFMVKEKNLEMVTEAFQRLMGSMNPEERRKHMEKIPFLKTLFAAADELEIKKKELADAKEERNQEKKMDENQRAALETKITALEKEVGGLEKKTDPSSLWAYTNVFPIRPSATNSIFYSDALKICDKCNTIVNNFGSGALGFSSFSTGLRQCLSCKRNICNTCWPIGINNWGSYTHSILNDVCPDCKTKLKTTAVVSP